MLADDPRAAEAELQRAHDELTELGERFNLSTVDGLLARALAAQGRLDEAEAMTRAVETVAAEDDVDAQAIWRGVRARILAARGEVEEGMRLANEAVKLRSATDSPLDRAEALMDLAEVELAAANPAACTVAMERALALVSAKGDEVTSARLRARREGIAFSSAS
jgi:ATP/maltotriose-dependent transcriptional regulator MalT